MVVGLLRKSVLLTIANIMDVVAVRGVEAAAGVVVLLLVQSMPKLRVASKPLPRSRAVRHYSNSSISGRMFPLSS
jgi:hypothetical protein